MNRHVLEQALPWFGAEIVRDEEEPRLRPLSLPERLKLVGGLQRPEVRSIGQCRLVVGSVVCLDPKLHADFLDLVPDLMGQGCELQDAIEIAADRVFCQSKKVEGSNDA